MKNILLLVCVCIITMMAQTLYGAYAVHPAGTFYTAPATTPAAAAVADKAAGHKAGLAYRIRERVHSLIMAPQIYGIHNKKGIFGTLALICGILSFIPVYGMLFGVAAIVLGCIGIHKHQKLALLGLVLGCAGILANIVYLTIIIIEALQGFTLAVF